MKRCDVLRSLHYFKRISFVAVSYEKAVIRNCEETNQRCRARSVVVERSLRFAPRSSPHIRLAVLVDEDWRRCKVTVAREEERVL